MRATELDRSIAHARSLSPFIETRCSKKCRGKIVLAEDRIILKIPLICPAPLPQQQFV
jgi:hypothetical protein